MRALIIDDERLARTELGRLLHAHPEVEVIGEAKSANEAEEKIAALRPEVIFLDVQMPVRTGFDLLQSLPKPPRVIFTTAYDQHALRAFEFGAVDYLLKPIDPARLAQALTRLQSGNGLPPATSNYDVPTFQEDDHVFLQDGERCWFVRLGDIRLLQAEGNYARVYFGEHRPLVLRSLQLLEARLDPRYFVRVSRQHLVNLRFVRKADTAIDRGLTLRLTPGDPQIKVTRRRARVLRERLTL